MNVLSLFDGISVARLALKNLNIDCTYFSSEIDKYCIQISEKHFPEITRLGDVRNISGKDLPKIDLLIAGSPCQDLSRAKRRRAGLQGKKSGLFYEFFRILKEVKPDYFLLENVLSPECIQISELLQVKPVRINSSLFTAQMRNRLYWTNIKFSYPKDKNIALSEVIRGGYTDRKKSYCVVSSYSHCVEADYCRGYRQMIYTDKSMKKLRKLTPVECEILQGLPENYTKGVSNTQRYKAIGNCFTLPVIEYILSFMGKELPVEQLNLINFQ